MERKDFLKGLGALAALTGITRIEPSEDGEMLDIDMKVSSRDGEFEWTQQIPSSLDPEMWAEIGISEEDMHKMLLSSWCIRAQTVARSEFRRTKDPQSAIEAAKNYVPGRPRRPKFTQKELERLGLNSKQIKQLLKTTGIKPT